jgi:hypothetical protein
MQRASAIAIAGAVTGILIAGSVASVAVINAASSSTSTDQEPIVAASIVETTSVQSVEPAPSLDQAPLPSIVVPDPSEPIAIESNASESTSRAEQQVVADSVPQPISAAQARQAAVAATPGKVLATSRVERSGYDAFAVQIERADGSVVTGYVEATSGVVFDWVVDKKAPAPAATYDDDYGDDDHGDDDHEDDDHEDDDHDEDDDDD